ncbi:hypothetical protein V8E36_008869 [Tilletia maclaganii]
MSASTSAGSSTSTSTSSGSASLSQAIQEALIAARAVSPQHQRQLALDERLSSVLAASASASSSSSNDGQLDRLRALFGPSSGRIQGEDRKGKRVVRSLPQDDGAEEELCWFDNTVVWSRVPLTLLHAFSFPTSVTHACWARFELSNVALAESAERPASSPQPQQNGYAAGSSAQFGPLTIPSARPGGFSLAQNHLRTADNQIRARSARKTSYHRTQRAFGGEGSELQQSNVQDAVCIFLERVLFLYFPTLGEERLIEIPFPIKGVFPLALGVLIQRELGTDDVYGGTLAGSGRNQRRPSTLLFDLGNETTEDTMQTDASETDLPLPPPAPLVYHLSKPFDDFTEFQRATQLIESWSNSLVHRAIRQTGPQQYGYLNRPSLRYSDAAETIFPDLHESFVFVSDMSDRTPLPIIVTVDTSKRCVRIYQYGIAGVALQPVQSVSAFFGLQAQGPPAQSQHSGGAFESQARVPDSQMSQFADDVPMTQESEIPESQSTVAALSQAVSVRTLGKGRPPARRSARIESERRSSGAMGFGGGNSANGNAGAGQSSGSSASQTHGRPSQRLSRRISSSTHGGDLRRVSTRAAIADRTMVSSSNALAMVGDELHAGLGMQADRSQTERGGLAEVMQGIQREQHQSQPNSVGMGRATTTTSQYVDGGAGNNGPHLQPVVVGNGARTRSASATQRPSHARRSSHLSMSRVVSGAPNHGALVGGAGAGIPGQTRHGSGSSSIIPVSGPGGVSMVGARSMSSRRQPSMGAGPASSSTGSGSGSGGGGPQPTSLAPGGAEVTANVAIGGSAFDPHDRSYAAATIAQQTEAMAHEPGAPIPLPLRPSPGPAHYRHHNSNDGGEEDEEDVELEGASDFARTFGGVALLEEIRIEQLDAPEKMRGIHAFITAREQKRVDVPGRSSGSGSQKRVLTSATLRISVPCSGKVFARRISETPVFYTEDDAVSLDGKLGYTLRSSEPETSASYPQIEATSAQLVARHTAAAASGTAVGKSIPESDVVLRLADGRSQLVLGHPAKNQPTLELPTISQAASSLTTLDPLQNLASAQISCPLTARVLHALDLLGPAKEGAQLRHAVLGAKQGVANAGAQDGRRFVEWDHLASVILGQAPPHSDAAAGSSAWSRIASTSAHARHHAAEPGLWASRTLPPATEPTASQLSSTDRRQRIIVLKVLHLLGQEMMTTSARVTQDLWQIAELVVRLAVRLGFSSWAEYWMRVIPVTASSLPSDPSVLSLAEAADEPVPSVGDALLSALNAGRVRDASSAEHLLDYFIGSARKGGASARAISPTILKFFSIYRTLGEKLHAADASPATRAQAVVDIIAKEGLTRSDIASLPFGYALPLWETIRLGQAHPDSRWSARELTLVDRFDLIQSRQDRITSDLKYSEAQLRTLPTTESLDPLSAVLFGADFRLDEIVKMMYTSDVTTIDFPERDEKKSDTDVKEEQSRVYWTVSERIKATTVGKGAFLLMSKPFVDTQLWEVPKLCLELRGEPNALITSWPVNKPTDAELEWPEFHNGVAAALSISAEDGQNFESDWIFSHYGPEPSASHAGFLFGLGLLGRLKSLGRVHAYRYFAPRHGITTIGIALGLGASFVGTGDPAVRQLMALQIAAFLPDGSAPLNQSMLTQTAGILGMGLTFMGSYHRWTAERLMAQIAVENIQMSDNPMLLRDAYSLSSGFALGLVMLGKGRRDTMTGAADRRMITSLVELIEGPQPVLFEGESSGLPPKDTTITNIPATVALGLIFLRSNRGDVVSQLLRLPTTVDALEYVRPDTLFARALAQHLIMWDDIRPDADWMERALPSYLRHRPAATTAAKGGGRPKVRERMRVKLSKFSETMQLAYLNIHAACCFAMGLKWAGSQNQEAADCLLREYDVLVELLRPASNTYYERIRRAALQTAKDLVLLSCAMILAGSGHLPLLVRLRLEHGKMEATPSQSSYGSFLCSHLALGFLFLGGGRYTFGTSDGAIACLLIACFPRFPATSSENRAHLQAYRHLWVLAVEPRLVVAQDVESGVVQSLDAVSRLKDPTSPGGASPSADSPLVQIHLPGQVPPYESLRSVSIHSEAFWSTELRVGEDVMHARRLLLTRRLPVKRRSGFAALTGSSSSSFSHSVSNEKKKELERADGGLTGLAAELALLVGNEGSAIEAPGADSKGEEAVRESVSLAAERLYALERRTLSTSLGLEHASTLGSIAGLVADVPDPTALEHDSHTHADEVVRDLLESYIREPVQRAWMRLLLLSSSSGRSGDGSTAGDSDFQRFAVRALVSALTADAPPEITEQGLLGLFWRATSLAKAGSESGGELERDAGRICEQIYFLRRLYALKRPQEGNDGQDSPLVLQGLGLAWASQGAGREGKVPLISPDLVDATARGLRARATRLWKNGIASSPRTAEHAFRAMLSGSDSQTAELRRTDWALIGTVFAGTSTPWLHTILRPLFVNACQLAHDQLHAGLDQARVRDVVGRVVDFTLEALGAGSAGGGGGLGLEDGVRAAFVDEAVVHVKGRAGGSA